MQYIKDLGLGGASIHSLDTDDFRGLCGEKYPLLSVIRRSLQPKLPNSIPVNKNNDLQNGRCEKQGLYSDPTDCAAYYVCRSGYAYHVKCKDDHMFDSSIGKCTVSII